MWFLGVMPVFGIREPAVVPTDMKDTARRPPTAHMIVPAADMTDSRGAA